MPAFFLALALSFPMPSPPSHDKTLTTCTRPLQDVGGGGAGGRGLGKADPARFRRGVSCVRVQCGAVCSAAPCALAPGRPLIPWRLPYPRLRAANPLSRRLPATPRPLPKDALELAAKLKKRGNKLYTERKTEEAERLYTQAIEITGDNATADTAALFCNRAACYLFQKQHDKVVADCDSALKLKPNYGKAHSRRAQAYERLGKLREAMVDYMTVSFLTEFKDKAADEVCGARTFLLTSPPQPPLRFRTPHPRQRSTLASPPLQPVAHPFNPHAQALNRLLKAKTEMDVRQTLATREKRLPSPYQIRTFLDAFEVDELIQEEETVKTLLPRVLAEPKNGDLMLRLASVRCG